MASNHIVSSSQSALNSHSSSPSPTSLQPSTYREYEPEEIDWDNLGFKVMPTDYMFIAKSCLDGNFEAGQLNPFGNIQLSPSAGILNYGQGLIEGTKAYRREDGRIYVFRPQDSAIRMQIGAERLCMPFPSVDQFVDAVKQTALANKRWQIPPAGKGSLYIRPLLMGSGAVLGVAPAPEYTFLVYSCPVGIYLKDGTGALSLYVEEEFHRSALGGAGGIKSITNYAPVMKAMRNAKGKGFTDVLYLDSVNNKYIEEASSSNIFLVKGKVISTPKANGTILEGVTKKSVIDIAHDLGYQVEERMIEAEELITADEVFCTGTALGVAAVGSVTYKGKRIEYKISSETISQQLNSRLVGIQRGTIEDKRNWIVEVK
ncbi:branched-chain-amino-acid aminotransferase 2, chloroplastic isoform X1 [Nicotiana tabacum]|uniref:Branched-chain-amino-acid aminotransferase 2, chloroplastic isoform X1 n=2 Tax=Nicotiana tabacum TaxID=4097 RepID=A0AC58SBJ0_TOBAC|nr:PREDICTED: branched-chain-amino-acid aminotransferase 2, chloroplastic-like isoform X1 [Nicotiana tabacum]XP_033516000.1 branched-chain-amino-acid aminotransferase 2, chloroplastic-like isoform X1 [Nicotiana tomentosiformis]